MPTTEGLIAASSVLNNRLDNLELESSKCTASFHLNPNQGAIWGGSYHITAQALLGYISRSVEVIAEDHHYQFWMLEESRDYKWALAKSLVLYLR
jgi:hypothetical protein